MRGPTTGARLRSTTTRRVPPTAGVERPLDARVAPREHQPALGLDLLDRAPALLAVLEGDVDVAALLGLELDLVGQPALELVGVGDQLPGALGLDGEDDFAADGWHEQPHGCTSATLTATRNSEVAHATGPHGRPAGLARRALVRHLLAAAARARRLRGRRDQRRDREPRRRAAAPPRGRGPGEGHPALRQLAGRRRLRRAGHLRHDALHQARRGDDLLRDRDVDGLADPRRRARPASAPRCRTRASSSTSPRRLSGPGDRHPDPRRGGDRAAAADRGDLRRAHRQAARGDLRRARARPLLHARRRRPTTG